MKNRLFSLLAICLIWCSYAGAIPAGDAVKELPLPEIPEGMTEPAERAGYLLAHFWDSMDFSNSSIAGDRAFMEQNLVNFFSVMPHATADARATAVGILFEKASADTAAYKLVFEIAEHYLYESGSPMHDEEMFIPFLNSVLQMGFLSDSELIRPRYMQDEVLRNRVGTEASDFEMLLRDGRTVNMRTLTAGSPTLMIFYDPECDHCVQVIKVLSADTSLTRLMQEDRINVLAVYPFGEEVVWNDDSLVAIPSGWTDAFSDLTEMDRYSFPEMPVLYMLDEDGVVIKKDATVEQIVDELHRMRATY